MRKIKGFLCLFAAVFAAAGLSLTVQADQLAKVERLNETERYDPKYYEPIGSTGGTAAYAMSQEEQFEAKVLEGLCNWQDSIDVSECQIKKEDVSTLYFRVVNNHPELFYVALGVRYSYNSDGIALSVLPGYVMNRTEAEQIGARMEEAADKAVSLITDDMEAYEKALVVHDWLAVNCEYDYENYNKGTVPDRSHTAYGALAYGTAVCDGYAKAYMYIMQKRLGFSCCVVSSDKMNHAWNLLQVGNEYYHVDVTWDDPTWDVIGQAYHSNFLLSDEGIRKAKHEGWEEYLQAGDASYENALWKNTKGSVIPKGSSWYYIDSSSKSLVKTDNILNGSQENLFTLDLWRAGGLSYYTESFSYLQTHGDQLIFNGPKEIYGMPFATEEAKAIYKPEIAEDTDSTAYNIYGFRVSGNTMYYAVQPGPNLKEPQKSYIQTSPVPGWEPLSGRIEIEGEARYGNTLTAKVTFESDPDREILYQWYRNGAEIFGETSSSYTLKAEDIGQAVTAAVTSEAYAGELRAASVTVQKAVSELPDDASSLSYMGNYGDMLSQISLPEHYSWAEPETILNKVGVNRYDAVYCLGEGTHEETPLQIKVETICAHAETELQLVKEATCTEAGYTGNKVCKTCGQTLETGKATEAKGHQYGEWKRLKEPTYTEEGEEARICGICQAKETRAVEKLVKPGESEKPNPSESEKPGEEGEEPGDDDPDVPEIKKGTTHTVGSTKYKVLSAGAEGGNTVAAAAPKNKKITSVSIQNTVKIEGVTFKITKIEDNAFKGCTKLKKVSVGANVREIGSGAFSGCTSLTKVSGLNKVTSIGSKAFYNCKKLTAVGSGSKALSQLKSIGSSAFAGCTKLKTVNLTSTKLTSIGSGAFNGDKALTKVTISSKSLKSIGSKAFYKCGKLKTIVLKTTKLKTVGGNALGGINKKAVIKVPSSKVKAYKKLFTGKTGFKSTMKLRK